MIQPSPSTTSAFALPDIDVPVEVLRLANQLRPSGSDTGVCILLTSVGAAEGKTILSRHLARAMVKFLGLQVLVCDLQKQEDALDQEPIFANTSLPGLNQLILPSGIADADIYKMLQRQLPVLRDAHDVLIFEGPPILAATTLDSVVIGRLFDRVLLLFQEKATPITEVKESLSLLEKAGAENVALVFNQSSALAQQIPRWNLIARIPRFLMRLRVLWRRFRGWWKERSEDGKGKPTSKPNEGERP